MNLNISAKQFLCPLYSHLSKSKWFKITLVAKKNQRTCLLWKGRYYSLKTSICLTVIAEICPIYSFQPSGGFCNGAMEKCTVGKKAFYFLNLNLLHWTADTMQMRMHWENMLVRHLDEVSLAKILLNWEKKTYTNKCKSRKMTRCTFSIQNTHSAETTSICVVSCVLTRLTCVSMILKQNYRLLHNMFLKICKLPWG